MTKQCPKCSAKMQKNGIKRSCQCWRCPKCGSHATDTDRKQGGQFGDTPPVSAADRMKAMRQRKKDLKVLE